QASILFADMEVGAGPTEAKAYELLLEYLLNEALIDHNVITSPMMRAADWRRAQKMTFVANRQRSVEDTFRGIVQDELRKLHSGEYEDVGEIQPAEQIVVPHWGTVDGGEEEEEQTEKDRHRKVG